MNARLQAVVCNRMKLDRVYKECVQSAKIKLWKEDLPWSVHRSRQSSWNAVCVCMCDLDLCKTSRSCSTNKSSVVQIGVPCMAGKLRDLSKSVIFPQRTFFHICARPVSFICQIVSGRSSHDTSFSRCYSRSSRRLPLSEVDEIEKVLDESSEIILEFAEVLGCSEAAVRDLVRRDTRLVTYFSKERVIAIMKLLLEHGFTAGKIMGRYQVFTRGISGMKSRLVAMESVKHYRHSMVMLLLSQSEFQSRMAAYRKEVEVMGEHSSQASYVAELLECTQDEVISLANDKSCDFLLTMPPSRLQKIVTLLRSYDFSSAEMRDKCLMLKCLPNVAQQRLERVCEADVYDAGLVPFILTNSSSHFESSFSTWVRNRIALGGYVSERNLLKDRLRCSEKELRSMLTRKPHIASMSSGKLKRCLDVLQNEIGLSCATIVKHGDLLHFRPERHVSRWGILQSLALSEHELVKELFMSERKFVEKYGY